MVAVPIMHVYILQYDMGKGKKGIHSIEYSGQTLVLMFEAQAAASRYAKKLKATGFPRPSIERIERLECENFCRDSGFLPTFVPVGFVPKTQEDRLLVEPPKTNLLKEKNHAPKSIKSLLIPRPINMKMVKNMTFLIISLISGLMALSIEYKLSGLMDVRINRDHDLLSNPLSTAAFVILVTILFIWKGQGINIQSDSVSPLSITKTQCRNFNHKSFFKNVLIETTHLLLLPLALFFFIQFYTCVLAILIGIVFIAICLVGVLMIKLGLNLYGVLHFIDSIPFFNSITQPVISRFLTRYTFILGTALAMSDIMYLAAIRVQILFPKGYAFICQILYNCKHDSENHSLHRIDTIIESLHKDIKSNEEEYKQNKKLDDAVPKKRTTIYYSDGGVNVSSSGYDNKYSRRMKFLAQTMEFDREVLYAYTKAKELLLF